MPRVLYIGAGSPWTGGAGYLVRQNMFLSALRDVAGLHLAMFQDGESATLPFPCELTKLSVPKRRPTTKVRQLIDDVLQSTPRTLRGYDLQASRKMVASLSPEKFDAVFAYRVDFAYFAGVLDHPRLILDIDDPEHKRRERQILATTGRPPANIFLRKDLQKHRRFEYAAAAGAKLAFVCQPNDAEGWPVRPVVVPNCVDVLENPKRLATEPRLLFVGHTMGTNSPNADALQFVLKEIWPTIQRAVPQAVLQIVGSISDTLKELATSFDNVEVTGFVPDLRPIYEQASIALAPIRFGTGTRVKIVEAFAHGCPVVSTPQGAEGIEASNEVDIVIANAPESFATACIDLLRDTEKRERIAQKGHELAKRMYDRKAQQGKLVKIFQALLSDSDSTRDAGKSAVQR